MKPIILCLPLFTMGCSYLGTSTMIEAKGTPCGDITYLSTKDQQHPAASCKVGPDGQYELSMGAGAAANPWSVVSIGAIDLAKGLAAKLP